MDKDDIEQNKDGNIRLPLGKNDHETVSQTCLKGFELKPFLMGRGAYGSVAQACLKDRCDYAVKMMRTQNVNKEEIAIIKELSGLGIGAKFIDSWECDPADFQAPLLDQPVMDEDSSSITMIVSEKWDSQLPFDTCIDPKILVKLCGEIQTLHELGLVHGDILEKNILVKTKDGKIVDATLTDFGTVDTVEAWKKDPNRIKDFIEYQLMSYLEDYYIDNEIMTEDVIEDPTHLDKALMWKLYKLCTGQGKTCERRTPRVNRHPAP
jgi:serine/threonine protein kinase